MKILLAGLAPLVLVAAVAAFQEPAQKKEDPLEALRWLTGQWAAEDAGGRSQLVFA